LFDAVLGIGTQFARAVILATGTADLALVAAEKNVVTEMSLCGRR
jgi:hypothetical protein